MNKMEQTKNRKGLNKENLKNLFKWEGLSKELFWIFFFMAILFSAYAYQRDIKMCKEYVIDPCSKCSEINDATISLLESQLEVATNERWNALKINTSKLKEDGIIS